MKLQQSNL